MLRHLSPCLALAAITSCAESLRSPRPLNPETPVERQMAGLLEKFDRWDYNGDGQLSINELAEASQRSGEPAAKIMEYYDTDRSGGISLQEVQAGYQRRTDQRP